MLEFQSTIPTVASDFQNALSSESTIEELAKKFGHLRPGTYDVNQFAYWEKPDFYFVKNKKSYNKNIKKNNNFEFNHQEIKGFNHILKELNVQIKVKDFIEYLQKAIQVRESTKFEFTRNLSKALDLIIYFGIKNLELSRKDVGYLILDDIYKLKNNLIGKENIKDLIKFRKKDILEKQLAKLPSVILNEENFLDTNRKNQK